MWVQMQFCEWKRVWTHIWGHEWNRWQMNQQAENHTEHVYMCRHTQAHESEVHFQLEMKREKQMACSRLHGALFESDYLLLKARDVSVKTKYSGANIWKEKHAFLWLGKWNSITNPILPQIQCLFICSDPTWYMFNTASEIATIFAAQIIFLHN